MEALAFIVFVLVISLPGLALMTGGLALIVNALEKMRK